MVLASFEDTQIGARQSGMAEAYSAIADDCYTLFFNPSGLVNIKQIEIASMYSTLYSGLDDDSTLSNQSFAFVFPINKRHSVGLGWYAKNFSELYYENTFIAGYGYRIFKILSIGANLKARCKRYASNEWTRIIPAFNTKKEVTKITSDLGFLLNLEEHFLGLSFQDLTQPDVGLLDKSILPMTARLAYFRQFTPNLKIGTDVVFRNKNYEINAGFENELKKTLEGFNLRGGFSIGNDQYKMIALGLGYQFDKLREFQINYAFNYPLSGIEGTLGSHLFSLDIKFGENRHLTQQGKKIAREKKEMEKKNKIKLQKEYNQALNLFINNRLIEAYEAFGTILKANPANFPKIMINCKKKRKLILKQIKEMIKKEAKSQDYYYAQGFVSYSKHDYKNAINKWSKITVLNPHFQEVSIYLDKIKTILKEEKERKITKKINKANVLLKTGVDLFKQQLYSEAILYFQSSYRLYPTEETKLYIRRSKIRLEKIIRKLESKQISKTESKAGINKTSSQEQKLKIEQLISKGIIEYRLKNFKKAMGCFSNALELDPENENLRVYQKRARMHLEKDTISIDKEDEDQINKLYKQGVMKYMQGTLPEAIKIWEEILTIDPNNEKVINSLIKSRKELAIEKAK